MSKRTESEKEGCVNEVMTPGICPSGLHLRDMTIVIEYVLQDYTSGT
jgi:hypothetical protein